MKSFLEKLKTIGAHHGATRVPKQHDIINPMRDWLYGLAVATLIFLGGVGYVTFDFREQFMSTTDVVLNTQGQRYNVKDVTYQSFLYAEREEMFTTLRQSVSPSQNSTTTPQAEASDESAKAETRFDDATLAQPLIAQ